MSGAFFQSPKNGWELLWGISHLTPNKNLSQKKLTFFLFFFEFIKGRTGDAECELEKFVVKKASLIFFNQTIETHWDQCLKFGEAPQPTENFLYLQRLRQLLWLHTSESHVNCIGQFLWHYIMGANNFKREIFFILINF